MKSSTRRILALCIIGLFLVSCGDEPTYKNIKLSEWIKRTQDEDTTTRNNALVALSNFPSEYNHKILPVYRNFAKRIPLAASVLYEKTTDDKDRDIATDTIVRELQETYIISDSIFAYAASINRREKDRKRIESEIDRIAKSKEPDDFNVQYVRKAMKDGREIWKE